MQTAFRRLPTQLDHAAAGPNSSRLLAGLLDTYKAKFSTSARVFAKDDESTSEQQTNGGEAAAEQQSDDEELPSAEELKGALDETLQALDEEKKRVADMKDKLIRTLADMENLRERTARQMQEARQFASADVVKSLLDVSDNLERAAGSVAEGDANGANEIDLDRALSLLKSLRDGVVMTDQILLKVLEKHGVSRFDPMGHPFDPNLHAALFQVPDATKESGTVAVVVKKGYMMHDRPLRAAEVGVAQNSDE